MAYSPTHVVPETGLHAWPIPDGSGAPAATLAAGLDVQVTERRADWAHIKCSNGWEAWVDGRRLVEVAAAVPPPTEPRSTPPVAPKPTAPAAPAAGWTRTSSPGTPSTAWSAPATAAQPQPSTRAAPGVATAGAAAKGAVITGPQIIALVGSAIVAVSSWFNWRGAEGDTVTAYKTPANFLLESDTGEAGLNLGIVVLVLGALGVIAALARPVRWLTIVVGAAAIAIGARFIQQTNTRVSDLNDALAVDVELFDLLDPGVYVAIGGGVVALVGGILSLRARQS